MPGARKSRQPSLFTWAVICVWHAFLAGKGMHYDDTPSLSWLITFARWMRKHPTRSEALLFGQLRKRKLGVRFRQQHVFPIGYIVDLYTPCAKLVVEIDGGVHRDPARARRDAARQRALETVYGVRFVRVSA